MNDERRNEATPEIISDLSGRLKDHVVVLAGRIGERNLRRYAALEQARKYISEELTEYGYQVSLQEFSAEGKAVYNIEVERRGTLPGDEIVIIGAHYDSVFDCPGANDNASGVAGLLELARLFRHAVPGRTLRFVAFVNEEPPYFKTDQMGSLVYARRARKRGERIRAMLSLETIGYFSDVPGSQSYPFPLSLFYPSTGNFIGFVADTGSRALLREVLKSFRRHGDVPAEGVAAPRLLAGIDWSDHWSFRTAGYPAVMVTDTALYRYDAYHTAGDTPEKLDYDRLARVIHGLSGVTADLAKASP